MAKLNLLLLATTTALVVVARVSPAYSFSPNGASKFGENAVKPLTETCRKAINDLHYVSPNLKSCYRNSGLYFSTPETVCSPNCFSATVEASKSLARACPVPDDRKSISQNNVYEKWSHKKVAAAACSKDEKGRYCLKSVTLALVMAENIKLNLTRILAGKDLRKELDCDGTCPKTLYNALKGEGKNAPVLYFFGYNGLDSLFQAYEKVCGFKKPYNGTYYGKPNSDEYNDTSVSIPDVGEDDTESTSEPDSETGTGETESAPESVPGPNSEATDVEPTSESYS